MNFKNEYDIFIVNCANYPKVTENKEKKSMIQNNF